MTPDVATNLPVIPGLPMVGAAILRQRWGWFVGVGLILVLLGAVALNVVQYFTPIVVMATGWLMIVGGLLQMMHAMCCKGWSGFFLDLLTGVLYFVAGLLIAAHPEEAARALTFIIAVMLIFGGVFRIIIGLSIEYQSRFWIVLHGMVSLLLGVMIWRQWPLDADWIIGMFVGIDMIFNGWALIMLGLAARNLPATAP